MTSLVLTFYWMNNRRGWGNRVERRERIGEERAEDIGFAKCTLAGQGTVHLIFWGGLGGIIFVCVVILDSFFPFSPRLIVFKTFRMQF